MNWWPQGNEVRLFLNKEMFFTEGRMTFISDKERSVEFTREIVKGPSKFDLMLALFDLHPITLVFDHGVSDDGPEYGKTHNLIITGLSRVDATAESWNFTATLHFSVRDSGMSLRDSHRICEGKYRTDTRIGTITIRKEGFKIPPAV